ncbi:phosphatidylglycerophosphatase A [Endozoicomonas sp. OPT23]|uniref:phosphatidylglycerophosphatase A family protein n=1 Tax=Endozoicomonas sp. OPT23 TaxID=2072845 RepID=UPI00129B24CA|nr:phosphatidylglycerophosphatase A [Endozoicomonas sp. OPT23]MRI32804.1 phosphatidylglycerophosphatase A [Endozoicomonas sp. OPT23]
MNPADSVWKNPVHFLAFGLGSGLAPKAPGTFGTLAAIPFYLLFQYLPLWNFGLVILVSMVLGVWLCEQTSKDLGVHDHPGIVWDEFVGYWITMFAAPAGWMWVIIGFVLFRIFDIWKPWPISFLDKKVHGGLGIMIDDVVAGVFALVSLQLIARFAI